MLRTHEQEEEEKDRKIEENKEVKLKKHIDGIH